MSAGVKATPGAIKLALEHNIALVNVIGSGTSGFITVHDVQGHINPYGGGRFGRLGDIADSAIADIDVDALVSARSADPTLSTAALNPVSKRSSRQPLLEPKRVKEETSHENGGMSRARDDELSPTSARGGNAWMDGAPRLQLVRAAHLPCVLYCAIAFLPHSFEPPVQILDLDNTLIHATEDTLAGAESQEVEAQGGAQVQRFTLESGNGGRRTHYLLRLRDGVEDFLKQALVEDAIRMGWRDGTGWDGIGWDGMGWDVMGWGTKMWVWRVGIGLGWAGLEWVGIGIGMTDGVGC